MARTHCGTIGFVRKEHVIKGATEHTQFYCGRCNQSWTSRDEERRGTVRPDDSVAANRPDRSRP